MMKATFSLVLFCTGALTAVAQPAYDFEKLKKEHPGENAVIIKNNCTYNIGIKKGQLDVRSTKVLGFTVLEDKANISNEYEVNYAPGFYEIESLQASTFVRGA